jgi:ABC-type transport system involved in cytochrome c biogenesis permease subunit
MNNVERFSPWLVIGLAVVYLIAMMAPPAESDERMRLAEFAALPLLDDGRVKPFDTLARNSLMIVSGKQTFVDEKGQRQPAVRWLLDVMTSGPLFKTANEKNGMHFPLSGETHRVFRIDNPEVVTLLGLERREGSRYAIDEFAGRLVKLEEEAEKVSRKNPKQLTPYEKGVHDLFQHLQVYLKLARWPQTLYAVPPGSPDDEWQTFQEARESGHEGAAVDLAMMLMAYANNDTKDFNKKLDDYQHQFGRPLAADVGKSGVEAFVNHFEPFYQCTILYVIVFILGCLSFLGWCLSWAGWTRALGRAAFGLAAVTLVVHTLALVGRMYLMDRWFVFVTNLYSSAVFIGWGCVGLCLVLERLFRNGVGNVLAAFCGAVTMLIAHHLGSDGDTLALLQPVLDTNFWLATHVTCVTMGYTATFVAGTLAMFYLLLGVLTPVLNKSLSKMLGQMIYGVVCFATLLSFTGTVLGGIWADQSWGRFWGWDPKENGALLIVIWNALVLHARWGGMVKQRGMAVLAVVGNMVTAWSWFGTNQLGVGLHAYGFNDTLANGLVVYWGVNLAFILMGLLPMKWWASYAALTAPVRPVESAPRPAEKPSGKRRGKRTAKPGEAGFFPGPA